ncbi:hypothetical protein [Pseudonocardia dioxanivorans]|uniref:hypothetical protein n=1 Tax=Pseudonocardia dioxanivorans TaxID=240495 RepID=UPI000CD26557|nr:hypothetical protein [Pseudonocardia dioxanivorans]
MLDPTGKINAFDQFDYRRSYMLPTHVVANIPRDRSHPYGYGAHEYARGLLVEAARFLDAHPVGLHYRDHEQACADRPQMCPYIEPCPTHRCVLAEVDLALTLPAGDRVQVGVSWWNSWYDASGRHQGWRLAIDGVPVPDEDRTNAPSALYTGALLRRQLHRRGRLTAPARPAAVPGAGG